MFVSTLRPSPVGHLLAPQQRRSMQSVQSASKQNSRCLPARLSHRGERINIRVLQHGCPLHGNLWAKVDMMPMSAMQVACAAFVPMQPLRIFLI